MSLSDQTREKIESIVGSDNVVLFMKGDRQMPRCGFSASTVSLLDALGESYTTVDVLQDPEIREGIKQYSSWPTIPQLYVKNEFMGGCDIVRQMFNSGELHQALGLDAPDRTPPEIESSPAAAQIIQGALAEADANMQVHLQIDSQWQHGFSLRPAEGDEVRAESNGIELLMDVGTAQRARGLVIDAEETMTGTQMTISNPNAPQQ